MHSRIFQISEEPLKEKESSSIRNCDLYHDYFPENIADSFEEIPFKSAEYFEELKWLKRTVKGIEVDVEKQTIIITNKAEYFKEKHSQFKELLNKLKDVTLEEFSSGRSKLYFDMYELNECYREKHGFYIDFMGDLTSLDEWVRSVEENKVFFIGTIIDYHF